MRPGRQGYARLLVVSHAHRLSDGQIAAHEAGHALVGHVLGSAIKELHTYTGPQSAKVIFVGEVTAEQVALAGSAGEFVAGYPVSPPDSCEDMNRVDLSAERAMPGAVVFLQKHRSSHAHLSDVFSAGRQSRAVIPGAEVHRLLDDLGCMFGSESVRG